MVLRDTVKSRYFAITEFNDCFIKTPFQLAVTKVSELSWNWLACSLLTLQ